MNYNLKNELDVGAIQSKRYSCGIRCSITQIAEHDGEIRIAISYSVIKLEHMMETVDTSRTFRPSGPSVAFATMYRGNWAMRQTTNDVEMDYSERLLLNMAELHNTKSMSDICLVVGREEYHAHRVVLCASSAVFQAMLINPESSESPESRVVLEETQGCMEIFGEFIKYLYTGKIEIKIDIIVPLLSIADKYKVKNLIDLCTDYMCKRVALAAIGNQLITWYQCTLSLGYHVPALACQDFLKRNFEMVAKGTDFGNCNRETVLQLLQWNDLVVTNEVTLFHYIEGWMEYQEQTWLEEGVNVESLLLEVMSHIRFPMMTELQLIRLGATPLFQKHHGFFDEKMRIAMAFHNKRNKIIQQVLQDETGTLMFTPRLYTSRMFCSTITIDDFTQFPYYQTRIVVYSAPSRFSGRSEDEHYDWLVNFFPKGVCVHKSFITLWRRKIEVPGTKINTFRVSITPRNVRAATLRVKVVLLVFGRLNGVEHIIRVVQKVHYFSKRDCLLNIDDVIPFDELHYVGQEKMNRKRKSEGDGGTSTRANDHQERSRYLIGCHYDTLKVRVVIVPLPKESSTAPQPDLLLSTR